MTDEFRAHAKYGLGIAILCDHNRMAQIPGEDIIAMTKEFQSLLDQLAAYKRAVIVLDEGAEPEVGDLVEGRMTNYGGVYIGHVTGFDSDTNSPTVMEDEFIDVDKIIQRNGLPCIYKSNLKDG